MAGLASTSDGGTRMEWWPEYTLKHNHKSTNLLVFPSLLSFPFSSVLLLLPTGAGQSEMQVKTPTNCGTRTHSQSYSLLRAICLCGSFHSSTDNRKLMLLTMTLTVDTSTAPCVSHVKASSILSTAIWRRKREDSYWFLLSNSCFLAAAHL